MASRVLQDQVSIAANATVNVLAGKRYENLGNDSLITFFQTAASASNLRAELFCGNRAIVEVGFVSGANRIPQLEDMIIQDFSGFNGEKLQLNVTNTTAGAIVYFYRFDFDDNVMRG